MFSTKNLSPNQLSALTALWLAAPISLGIYAISPNVQIALISFGVIYLGCFLLIKWVLEWFIYRKIKLIYKFIFQTKASKKEEMYYRYILPQKSIDEVREDVERWAVQRRNEIEELKSNEAYRKEFLQNLSHEFKTPVFAIQGYVDTLLDGAIENPALAQRFLENTSKNVQRLSTLLNDLDEITKLESGEQPLYKENFIIQEVIKEVFEELSIKTMARHMQVSIKKGCEVPITVFADRDKIKQVLTNLVTNATKYGKEYGQLVASIYKTDGEHVLVEISDDGIGIAEEHLPRVFERFYRTDKGRSRNKGGSGLGLAICKHIIEAHNETIHIRSKLDIGTTVGFTISAKKDG